MAPDATTPAATPPTPAPSAAPTAAPTPVAEPVAEPEVRAVWVHLFDHTLKTPQSVDRMLDRVARANLNTVIVEVVRRQDAYYDSDVLVRSPDPALAPGFDLLDHVTAGAHERGLQIQAWYPTITAYHHAYDDLAHPAGWIWTEHGREAPEDQRWVTRLHDGTWDDHLDPGLPEVREHVAAVAAELAAHAGLDAIHLDYVRYPDRDTGYHPRALARFRQETGRTGTPAPQDPAWSEWRREQVRLMVEGIVEAVHAVAPDLPVTAAVIAQGEGPVPGQRSFTATSAYARYHQDWVGWLHSGLLDAVMPMNYFDAQAHPDWFDQWASFERQLIGELDALLVGGMAGYLNHPEDSLAQIEQLRRHLDGVALYSFQQTARDEPYDRLFDLLVQQVWPGRAAVPPWR
ncbi:MAG TPA: family 10 glycosylhydrolase [Nitriliruptorales bacterium]